MKSRIHVLLAMTSNEYIPDPKSPSSLYSLSFLTFPLTHHWIPDHCLHREHPTHTEEGMNGKYSGRNAKQSTDNLDACPIK
ncbi:hypothetical protein, partial [Enterococcus faecium]|uniref:hypothetical protein n=1 Tax=Enterococcus faecium TaxID=1352 RepID=UPI003F51F311